MERCDSRVITWHLHMVAAFLMHVVLSCIECSMNMPGQFRESPCSVVIIAFWVHGRSMSRPRHGSAEAVLWAAIKLTRIILLPTS